MRYLLLIMATTLMGFRAHHPPTEEKLLASELIAVVEYIDYVVLRDELFQSPLATFKVIKILKGIYTEKTIDVPFDFHETGGCLIEPIKDPKKHMPKIGTHFIIFANKNGNSYRTYGGKFGRRLHSVAVEKLFVPKITKVVAKEKTINAAETFGNKFRDPKSWKVIPAPGGNDDHCDAMSVGTDNKNGRQSLSLHPIGKSSHACNSAVQVQSELEIPGSVLLDFFIAKDHFEKAKDKIHLKVVSEDGKKTHLDLDITPFSNDLGVSELRRIHLVTPSPIKVKFVIETTCRSMIRIQDIKCVPFGRKERVKGPVKQEYVFLGPEIPCGNNR